MCVYVCVLYYFFFTIFCLTMNLHIATGKRAERQHQHSSQIKEYLTVYSCEFNWKRLF